jgi:LPXTG-site transpeptidase (sortase) family protein
MEKPVSFALTFFVLFTLLFVFLAAADALPEPTTTETQTVSETPQTPTAAEAPVRIVAKDIGLDAQIVTPASTDPKVMDEALTHGAMRWPTSAMLGVNGTIVLFGHSSYLPIVYHQYYKTFDEIQTLKTGAVVSVYSTTTEYRYKVTGVRVASAIDDVVELRNDKKYLTLVTCDSFTKKTDRFVVTAEFVGAYAITSS